MINLFNQHNPATDYTLATIEEFKLIPSELRSMYAVFEPVIVRSVPVIDNHEPLVDLEELIQHQPSHIKLAIGLTPTGSTDYRLQLRVEAAKRLLQAEQLLLKFSSGQSSLMLTDAYRPLAVQRKHFNSIKQHLSEQGLVGDELYNATLLYISDPDLVPPHSLGGTVDLTLVDIVTGNAPDMGTVVDAVDTPLIYTWHGGITDLSIRERRIWLFNAMHQAGFCNYAYEWWHYSYGDQRWALEYDQTTTLYAPL